MIADLINDVLTESSRNGFLNLTYTLTYQVIADNKGNSAFDVLTATGLPLLNSSFLTPGGNTLYVINRQPQRSDVDSTGRKWTVTVTMSNDTEDYLRDQTGTPVDTPDQAVKKVDISYEEVEQTKNSGYFIGITSGAPFNYPGATNVTQPPWFPAPNNFAYIGNTATDLRELSVSTYRKRIAVGRYETDYKPAYEDYLGKTNSDEITIEESDGAGVRWTQTFPIGTLLMKDITKQNFWSNQRLYYWISYVMDYNEFGHSSWVPDSGENILASTANTNPFSNPYANYSAAEVSEVSTNRSNQPCLIPAQKRVPNFEQGADSFTAQDYNVELLGTIPLNGHGNPIEVPNDLTPGASGPFFVNYNLIQSIAFTPLAL